LNPRRHTKGHEEEEEIKKEEEGGGSMRRGEVGDDTNARKAERPELLLRDVDST
jgi:hypothetical protein